MEGGPSCPDPARCPVTLHWPVALLWLCFHMQAWDGAQFRQLQPHPLHVLQPKVGGTRTSSPQPRKVSAQLCSLTFKQS